MGLISAIVGLPLAPLRGTVAVGQQVLRQAEETYYDPALIKRQLERVDELRAQGSLTDEEAEEWEEELLQRLVEGRSREGR